MNIFKKPLHFATFCGNIKIGEYMEERKRLYSGVQPTNNLTIGNYLGTIKSWTKLQAEYDCMYSVVDLHAITVRQNPAELRQRTLSLAALFIACGVDPEKAILYIQSHVHQHAELCWILNTFTYVGEMERMTQFKDKSARHADNINMGLMDYPVLMAADILLYQTDMVPVGEDQRQHLEISRDIAQRFNNVYTPTFKVPEGIFPKYTAKIYDLSDPAKKMSKSAENPNGSVFLSDGRDTIIRKFKRAVTDSDSDVRYDPKEKPGVSNLISIYSAFTGKQISEVENEFAGKGYGDFKLAVGEAVADSLAPIQAEWARITSDRAYLEGVLKAGAEKASRIAEKTLSKVKRKVGFLTI